MNCIVYGVAKSQTRLSDFHFHSLNVHRVTLKMMSNTAERSYEGQALGNS